MNRRISTLMVAIYTLSARNSPCCPESARNPPDGSKRNKTSKIPPAPGKTTERNQTTARGVEHPPFLGRIRTAGRPPWVARHDAMKRENGSPAVGTQGSREERKTSQSFARPAPGLPTVACMSGHPGQVVKTEQTKKTAEVPSAAPDRR
jgi:hypothetical protein